MTNGRKSPVFEDPHSFHYSPKKVLFDQSSRIRAVAAAENKKGTWNMQFRDEDENVVCEYNPFKNKDKVSLRKLGENEELIGVYGVKDQP